MSAAPVPASPEITRAPVTTTDALKVAALLIILVDHVGHFLAPDETWLRVIGRLGAPIFFFLIGFAKTRSVPWTWLALGAALTAVDIVWNGGWRNAELNILFNFAIIRLAAPWIERTIDRSAWWLLPIIAFLLGGLFWAGSIVEYGAEGWLIALAGLLQRRVVDGATQWVPWWIVTGLIAANAYLIVERNDYSLEGPLVVALAVGLAGLVLILARFQRCDLGWQPGSRLARVLAFAGRRSLELYAAQILLLFAVGGTWNGLDPGYEDD